MYPYTEIINDFSFCIQYTLNCMGNSLECTYNSSSILSIGIQAQKCGFLKNLKPLLLIGLLKMSRYQNDRQILYISDTCTHTVSSKTQDIFIKSLHRAYRLHII